MTDPLLQLTLVVPLALLFFLAARQKQSDGMHFEAQLGAYRVVPEAMLPMVARSLPVIELAVAVLILLPATRGLGAISAAALLIAYAAGMATNLLRGRDDIDCGCGATPQVISAWLVLRNLVLAAAAVIAAQPVVARDLGWKDLVLLAVVSSVLALTYAMVEQLISNHSTLKKWGRNLG